MGKGLGFAMHRNAKLEEYKAKTLGTTDVLGSKDRPIKVEDFIKTEMKQEIGDHFTLGGSSSSKVKKEEDGIVKEEYVKEEIKQEGDIKQEDADIKEEIQDSLKREREDEDDGDGQKGKKAKKDKKE